MFAADDLAAMIPAQSRHPAQKSETGDLLCGYVRQNVEAVRLIESPSQFPTVWRT
jgi:hypothetical protein